MEHIYGESVKDFEVGSRVELHPATDAWMQGDRFGEVAKIGRKWIHVKMEPSGRTLQMSPGNLRKIVNQHLPQTIEEEAEAIEDLIDEAYEPQVPPVCDNRLVEALAHKRPTEAQVFSVGGQRISTRSSKAWKRRLAKKLAKKVSQ